MKRILLDVNVVLDVLLDREPHAAASGALWAAIEAGRAEGRIAAHAVTTIHYLLRKEIGSVRARRTVAAIMRIFEPAAVDRSVLANALDLSCPDFEDGVTAAAAENSGCDFIATRDAKDFRGSLVPVLAPEALLPLIMVSGSEASPETSRH